MYVRSRKGYTVKHGITLDSLVPRLSKKKSLCMRLVHWKKQIVNAYMEYDSYNELPEVGFKPTTLTWNILEVSLLKLISMYM